MDTDGWLSAMEGSLSRWMGQHCAEVNRSQELLKREVCKELLREFGAPNGVALKGTHLLDTSGYVAGEATLPGRAGE